MKARLVLAILVVTSLVAAGARAGDATATPHAVTSTVVITEGFEGSTFPPEGWASWLSSGGSASWSRWYGYGHSGEYGAGLYGSYGQTAWLVLPPFTAPEGGFVTVSFWQRSDNLDYGAGTRTLQVCTSNCDQGGAGWSTVQTLPTLTYWTSSEQTVSVLAGESVRFAIRNYDMRWEYWFVDDFEVTFTRLPELGLGPVAIVDDTCLVAGPGQHDLAVDPGEVVALSVALTNAGAGVATMATGTLSSVTPGVEIWGAQRTYSPIPPGATMEPSPPFNVFFGPDIPCGTVVPFTLSLSTDEGYATTIDFGVLVGKPDAFVPLLAESFNAALPTALPTGWSSVVTNPAGAPGWVTLASPDAPTSPNVASFLASAATVDGAARLQHDFDVDLTAYGAARLRFAMRHEPGSPDDPAMDRIQVVVSSDHGATWLPVAGAVPRFGWLLSDPTWQTHTVDLSGFAGSTVRVGFLGISDEGSDCLIDDVVLEASTVSCQPCVRCELTCDASAAPTSGHAPLDVVFSSSYSTTNCSTEPSILWQFGDGQTSTLANPTHYYPIDGTFTWTMTMTRDGVSCTRSGLVDVAPAADLSLNATTSSSPVRPGSVFDLDVLVFNQGPSDAADVVVTVQISAGLWPISTQAAGFTCVGDTTLVTCSAPTLPAMASRTIQITLRAPVSAEPFSIALAVASSTYEVDPTDNAGTISDQVFGLVPAALDVDLHAGAGTASNLNGMIEPGEVVAIAPWWHSPMAIVNLESATASSFGGPGGPSLYTLADATANYGLVAPGATVGCRDGSGNCFALGVAAQPTRPALHWDATFTETLASGETWTWTLHVGRSFADVPPADPDYRSIETVLHNGVTQGCTATEYCPGRLVTRAQMATFISRVLAGSDAQVPTSGTVPGRGDFACGSGGVSLFSDVSPTASYCPHVHYMLTEGITQGCSATAFCPGATTSRGQMAMFVARAVAGGDAAIPVFYQDAVTSRVYSCDPTQATLHYADVAAATGYCRHVHYLWARALDEGCASTPAFLYCPTTLMDRRGMAGFLTSAFDLGIDQP